MSAKKRVSSDGSGLAARALTAVLVVYILMLGGTFTGVLLVEAQLFSLSLLTLGVLAWLLLLRGRIVPIVRSPLELALAAWIVAVGVSAILHPSGRVAIAVWWTAFYAGVWLLLDSLRQRGLRGIWITDAALMAAVPLMLLAIAQVQQWYVDWLALDAVRVAYVPLRPPSTLGNANALGTVLAMLLPFALARMYFGRHCVSQVLLGAWIIGAVLVLYLTFSRGAWLSAATGLAVLLAVTLSGRQTWTLREWWGQRSRRMRRAIMIVSAVLLASVLLLGLISLRAFDTPRRGTSTRLFLWGVAWDTFRIHPVAGRGPGTYGLSLLERWSFPPEQPHAGAHNIVLNVAAELGLFGLVALGLSVGLIAWHGWRAVRQTLDPVLRTYRAACLGGLAALGIHTLVDLPLMVPAITFLMIALVVVLLPQRNMEQHLRDNVRRPQGWLRSCLAVVLWTGVLVTGWWSTLVYIDYSRGEHALADGERLDGRDVLHDVAQTRPELALYHAQYGYACGLAAATGDTGCVPNGIAAYRRALQLEPQHAVWWANLAALYWQRGQSGAAIDALHQAVHYAPDAADFWLALGRYYEALGQMNAARVAYRHVLDAHDEWTYIDFWDTTPLRRAVRMNDGSLPSPYERALFLWRLGEPDRAVSVLNARIERDPSQPRPYVQLARLHIVYGMYETGQDHLDAARVLVHTPYGAAWIAVVEAELARAAGDLAEYAMRMSDAESLVFPGDTGYTLLYGQDVAYFHFWRVRIVGVLLPQLPIYGHDPQLTERIRAGTDEVRPLR